ncbi:co-chaperone DjlA [Halieaceae bacterium IMCC8485]|uniref:Co-chaperone protein DjlA n=1 Tax=Candidatus Seongchinamella marina TaxID=2518990 RepID=A0ABT3SUM4_9GAMM|nr:co-chaperone DjlA [Candidatus Seongchinamella marina]MCX2973686.1 co-chaperone DjlA [Candidatus Seongchinamella marina]
MYYGKIIGGVIGLMVLGPIGLILGIFVGHLFDNGLMQTLKFASPQNIARIKNSFFETTFLLSGYLAKADGRISQQEIDQTESIISQMGLDAQQRKRAINLFQQGSAQDFQLEPTVSSFMETCRGQRQLCQTLLFFLISLALADHKIEQVEHNVLQRIATLLSFSPAQLEQMLRMAQAQGHFHGSSGYGAQPGTSLEDAYEALGIASDVDDKALKRAYRKLMSENHPDKLIAKGVPEDMIKLATERSQEIQAAYEMIKKSRA